MSEHLQDLKEKKEQLKSQGGISPKLLPLPEDDDSSKDYVDLLIEKSKKFLAVYRRHVSN